MTKETPQSRSDVETDSSIISLPNCGIVRPIANVEGYPDGHWLEVHQIIVEAATAAGFNARLVSDDEAIGVILGRIVSNLHDDPIVVIDVSGLNPNVMFELGMRLAFDKPVVVIKDNITRYPFDASPIEYVPYPSDLRHAPLMAFKEKLVAAIRNTSDLAGKQNYRTFLKHFGSYKPGELGEDQTLGTRLILDEMQSLKSLIRRSSVENDAGRSTSPTSDPMIIYKNFSTLANPSTLKFRVSLPQDKVSAFHDRLADDRGVTGILVTLESKNQYSVSLTPSGLVSNSALSKRVQNVAESFGGAATAVT